MSRIGSTTSRTDCSIVIIDGDVHVVIVAIHPCSHDDSWLYVYAQLVVFGNG